MTAQRQHRAGHYAKVFDSRKRRVRGLWERNGSYYAQLTIVDDATGRKAVRRVRLEDKDGIPIPTVGDAIKAMAAVKVKRDEQTLTIAPKRTPTFNEYADSYLSYFDQVKDAKKKSTIATERVCLRHWREHLGEVRLSQITRAMVNGFVQKRQAAGRSGRTVNLEVICFRNVMKKALEDGWITRLPTEKLKPLKWAARKRALVTSDQITALCNAALAKDDHGHAKFRNGQQFADYVRFLQYSGARRNETLRVRWADVDFKRKQVTIGADGDSKNRQARVLDFNPKLEAHLCEMKARYQGVSQWLFPSPQRGDRDTPAHTFVETMRIVRRESKLPPIGFHDCRHHFISMCVMSGIDFMTIAKWVGHQDGGILIGKVYGHLSNEHAQAQAQRIVFEPALVGRKEVAL